MATAKATAPVVMPAVVACCVGDGSSALPPPSASSSGLLSSEAASVLSVSVVATEGTNAVLYSPVRVAQVCSLADVDVSELSVSDMRACADGSSVVGWRGATVGECSNSAVFVEAGIWECSRSVWKGVDNGVRFKSVVTMDVDGSSVVVLEELNAGECSDSPMLVCVDGSSAVGERAVSAGGRFGSVKNSLGCAGCGVEVLTVPSSICCLMLTTGGSPVKSG
jgi:hypothetical protein